LRQIVGAAERKTDIRKRPLPCLKRNATRLGKKKKKSRGKELTLGESPKKTKAVGNGTARRGLALLHKIGSRERGGDSQGMDAAGKKKKVHRHPREGWELTAGRKRGYLKKKNVFGEKKRIHNQLKENRNRRERGDSP